MSLRILSYIICAHDSPLTHSSPDARKRYSQAYAAILTANPRIRPLLDELQDHPLHFNNLMHTVRSALFLCYATSNNHTQMEAIHKSSRSDDTSSLNKLQGRYWLVDLGVQTFPENRDPDVWDELGRKYPNAIQHMAAAFEGKHMLGFKDTLTARLLCPIRHLKQFDTDPKE